MPGVELGILPGVHQSSEAQDDFCVRGKGGMGKGWVSPGYDAHATYCSMKKETALADTSKACRSRTGGVSRCEDGSEQLLSSIGSRRYRRWR